MRLVVTDFMSLDGVVQAPGGPDEDTDGAFAHGGWSMPFFDPTTMGPAIGEAMESAQALLYGRRTWQAMAAAWPERAGDPFADQMNSIDKYVVSRSLTPQDMALWNRSVLLSSDDVAAAVLALSVLATSRRTPRCCSFTREAIRHSSPIDRSSPSSCPAAQAFTPARRAESPPVPAQRGSMPICRAALGTAGRRR